MKKPTNQSEILRKMLASPGVVFFAAATLLFSSELIGTVLASLAGKSGDDVTALFIVISTALALVLLSIFVVFKVVGGSWAAIGYVKPRRPWVKSWLVSVIVYILISSSLVALATWLLPQFNANQAQDVGLNGVYSPAMKVLGFISLVIITPIFEETIFRGILFKGLRRSITFYPALVLVSLLFALAHGQWNVAIDTFALGLLLGYLTEKTGSIVPSILLHATKNMAAFLILFVFIK